MPREKLVQVVSLKHGIAVFRDPDTLAAIYPVRVSVHYELTGVLPLYSIEHNSRVAV